MNNGYKTPEPTQQSQQKVEPADDSFLDKPKTNTAIEIDNMLSDKSDQSVNSNFFLYIFIFVIAAGLVMTYLVFIGKLGDTNNNVSNLTINVAKINKPALNSVTTAAVTNYLLPSIGVQLLVPNTYSDLTSETGSTSVFSSSSTQAVFLSSKSITNSDAKCSASSVTIGGSPLGIIAKISGNYPSSGSVSAGVLLIQTKTYYIAYMPSTTSCSANQSTISLINQYRFYLSLNPSTVSLSN